jgi:exosome complex RNA-binding protein Csl4
MKRPIIIAGRPFDWEEGERYRARVVAEDGSIDWMAAAFADPGVMKCPGCGEFLWNEGSRVRCPHCTHEWEKTRP